MPTRLIREGIIGSDRVELLEPAEEVFYRRLLNKVDDFGLYDARPSILRANLYPLRLNRVREADISRWMAACQKAGLIVLYENGGKPYLMALDTRWQTRSEPKYPRPPQSLVDEAINGCKQLQTVVPVVVVEDVVEDVGGVPAQSKEAAERPKLNGHTVEYIPLLGGTEYGVPSGYFIELERLYPAVDAAQTLREIRAWCLSNPKKLKTKNGVQRFINRWFEKEQNHG